MCAGALLAACSSKPPPKYEIVVKVQSDPGVPLAGAVVLNQNKPVGKRTDKTGKTGLSMTGAEGQAFTLNVRCPDGYKSPTEPLVVTLRRIVGSSKRPEYMVDCPPKKRSVVVAIRAENGPDIPVRYLGKEVARTDTGGAANVLLKLSPNESFKLTLDTSDDDHKLLQPQSPAATFDVKNKDDIFVFDQKFKKKRVYHYYHRRTGPTPL